MLALKLPSDLARSVFSRRKRGGADCNAGRLHFSLTAGGYSDRPRRHGRHDPSRAVDDGAASDLYVRRCFVAVITISISRLPHLKQISRPRHSGTGISTTYRSARPTGSG